MVKRPPFEEANYPPPPGRTNAQWILFGIIIAAVAVIAAFSYNYWDYADWIGTIHKP